MYIIQVYTNRIYRTPLVVQGFPQWLRGKQPTCQCRRLRLRPWVGKIPWRRKWPPTPVLLPGNSHGQRCLAGLQSMGSQRVRRDLSTKQQQQLVVQWLRLLVSSTGGLSSIPDQGTKSQQPLLKNPSCLKEDPAQSSKYIIYGRRGEKEIKIQPHCTHYPVLICWIIEKAREFSLKIYFCLIHYTNL